MPQVPCGRCRKPSDTLHVENENGRMVLVCTACHDRTIDRQGNQPAELSDDQRGRMRFWRWLVAQGRAGRGDGPRAARQE